MSSPAERYAAARRRGRHPALTEFAAGYRFELDPFQTESCEWLEDGYGVLVCAPTGAGKTVVGEFAVHLALVAGQKCFYTTPIKALSNQKFADLVERYGADQVGLLTGDNAVNSNAAIVVMTTEVLRNMLYVGSDALTGLGYVVLDEVHYLGDRFRGAVWEEAIIHLPASVRLVSLSATVSNAEEFGEWLVSVRGDTKVIVHEERPVPLWQHLLVGPRLFDLFSGEDPSVVDPELVRHISSRYGSDRYRDPRRDQRRAWRPPYRPEVIERLDREGLLPAITFIFSRAGCDAAVRQCVQAGLWLTSTEERDEITAIVERGTASIAGPDLEVLGYWEWLDGLRRGIAAHHAGLVPAFKEVVEQLFVRGLVRAVFATETLALGINMPARTVVLERLTKFNGEGHADITPGEYTQLTGRAGRRGIDIEGHAVVVWGPDVDPARVAGLASTRTYPLRSSFRPSYNMAVNLVGQMGRPAARQLLESSFAQFQTDRSVAGLVKQIRRNDTTMADYAARMSCHLGDITEYFELRRRLGEVESQAARRTSRARQGAIVAALEALHIGDVIRVPRGRRAGLAIVLDPGVRLNDDPRPLVLTEGRWAGRVSPQDFSSAIDVVGRVKVPKRFNHRSPQERRDLAASLRSLDLPPAAAGPRRVPEADSEIAELRGRLRAHPCHGCADREEHARWGQRRARLERETVALRQRIEGRTGSLGRAFDRICGLLDERGYLDGDQATPLGRVLARIWSESDLLVAECLRAGVWDGLEPAEFAAAVSALVYEARREERFIERLPTGALRSALAQSVHVWAELADDEAEAGLPRSREPELGLVWPVYRWARNEGLDRVLDASADTGAPLSAGDFVRWGKQLIDLLDQVAAVGSPRIATTARAAIEAVRRGVVAQSMSA
ncbi:MAG: DEAD/DEAH box helicase [Actinobacteria bacterium]|nr:DEAD/DEAH box helicase [Actinomycetota bacterium]